MSFNRTKYDNNKYTNYLERITQFAEYNIKENTCDPCYNINPTIRLQKSGNISNVNNENDLFNLTRKNNEFIPECNEGNNCKSQHLSKLNSNSNNNLPNCNFSSDSTRLTDNSNISEIGNNRWEWLRHGNPQNFAIPNFELNISTRINEKDNHVFETPSKKNEFINCNTDYSCFQSNYEELN